MSQANPNTSLTIYSSHQPGEWQPNAFADARQVPGFAVIRQQRPMLFRKGQFSLSFDEVAAHIDPTTVTFNTENEVAQVLDQDYQFDLIGSEQLLQRYLDQDIRVNHNLGDENVVTEGTLLSTKGGLTIQTRDKQITTIKT